MTADRNKYVFSFRAASSAKRLTKRFRVSLVNNKVMKGEKFTIHDCRRIALQDVYDHEGIKAASKMAAHASIETTL